jgi:hypothetical protein
MDLLDQCTTALQDWFNNNGLCLNPSKSEIILVGTRQKLSSAFNEFDASSVKIAGCPIVPSNSIKNLGVLIDSTLSFNSQVDSTCKAIHFHLRALKHIRKSITTDTAKTIACSIIGSRLDYCNSLLAGTSERNIMKLQRAQNTAARVVMGVRKFDHITPALKTLHWLPVKDRITFKIASIVFKTKLYKEPGYLATLLQDYAPSRQLRSSDQNLISVASARTVIGSRGFSITAPTVWNNLPDSVKKSKNTAEFNNKLKTYLFTKTYCAG